MINKATHNMTVEELSKKFNVYTGATQPSPIGWSPENIASLLIGLHIRLARMEEECY